MKAILPAGVVVTLFLACNPAAAAGTAQANLTVSATVVDLCSASDATVAFGTVNPAVGTTLPTTGLINVTCSLGTAFTVGLDDGLNASSGNRRMKRSGTSDYLTYNLYKDALMSTRFGDTGSSDRAAGTGLGLLPTPISAYGTVASGQSAPPGGYSDTVQITVYY